MRNVLEFEGAELLVDYLPDNFVGRHGEQEIFEIPGLSLWRKVTSDLENWLSCKGNFLFAQKLASTFSARAVS